MEQWVKAMADDIRLDLRKFRGLARGAAAFGCYHVLDRLEEA